MYECFHCGMRTVIWDSDFDFEDFGYEGEGIVHVLHCTRCGAEITYAISCENDDEIHGREQGCNIERQQVQTTD